MLSLIFSGYLGDNCKTRIDGDNVAITFNVGVTKRYKDRQNRQVTKTTWVGCTLWRKKDNLGTITDYLLKGKPVLVQGEPSVRAYKTTEGDPKAVLDCRVITVELQGSAPHPQEEPEPVNPPAATNPDNEDLPF
jgi:single-strand DNA-binding protein